MAELRSAQHINVLQRIKKVRRRTLSLSLSLQQPREICTRARFSLEIQSLISGRESVARASLPNKTLTQDETHDIASPRHVPRTKPKPAVAVKRAGMDPASVRQLLCRVRARARICICT